MKEGSGALTLPSGKAKGDRIFWRKWLPDGDTKAAVLLVHGYAEHCGRYQHVAQHLTDRGYAVYALDHWGHGQSDGDGGYIPAFSVLLDGVDAFYKIVKAEQDDLPLVLLGHSMGGLISVHELIAHQHRYAAAAISGPAIVPTDDPSPVMLMLSGLLSKFTPRIGVIPPLADAISRDPAVVAAYKADPLVYQGKMGARLAHEMFDAMGVASENAPAISIPILLMHGDQDALAAPRGSQLLYDNVTSVDKKLVIHEGLHHEIFNEPEGDDVLTQMTDWLEERLK